MTIPATIENVLNLYLYGDTSKPSDIVDRLRDLPPEATYSVAVDASAYMASVGRFAHAAHAQVVKDFFGGMISSSLGTSDDNGRITLTLSDYINATGKSGDARFVISQYTTGITEPDFKERAFIWGTTAFEIDPSARFVWDNGQLSIENLIMSPRSLDGADENFDFQTSNEWAQVVNENLFEPVIDPYYIGRIVEVEFSGLDLLPITVSYTDDDYYADMVSINQEQSPLDYPFLLAQAGALAADLLAADAVDYFYEGKAIVYGTYIGDVLTPAIVSVPGISDTSGYGLAIVAGAGSDTIIASDHDDLAHGGKDDDSITGNGGDDVLYGESGTDDIHGGSGNDAIFGGSDTDLLYGDDGNDAIVDYDLDWTLANGGDGHDYISVSTGSISGGSGSDYLSMMSDGLMNGGLGNDCYVLGTQTIVHHDGTSGHDYVINEFGGQQNVVLEGTLHDWEVSFYISTMGDVEWSWNDGPGSTTYDFRTITGVIEFVSLDGTSSIAIDNIEAYIQIDSEVSEFGFIDPDDIWYIDFGAFQFTSSTYGVSWQGGYSQSDANLGIVSASTAPDLYITSASEWSQISGVDLQGLI